MSIYTGSKEPQKAKNNAAQLVRGLELSNTQCSPIAGGGSPNRRTACPLLMAQL
jgi:hypothetical protein